MPAPADVEEEGLGGSESRTLATDRIDAGFDDHGTTSLAAVKDRPDLRETHPHTLAGQHDPAPAHVLVRIVSMPRTRPVGHNDAFVFPMPQYVRGHPEFACCLTDLHPPIMPS
nr:hypothetical protein [Brevibacterium atlanticum]